MNHPAKNWKSLEEQIEILQARGMIIDDEQHAAHFLQRVGYYRLSGYWYPFRQFNDGNRANEFVNSSRFTDVIALYLFDRKLRLLALDAIERIELAIQVEIAHLLGGRDAFAHESSAQLHGIFSRTRNHGDKSNHEKWLEDYYKLVHRSRRKPFVKHNLDKYGKLPVWVAIEVFDFSTLSRLYTGMKQQDKLQIETQFGLNEGKHLQTWLRGLNFIRNTAAHHSRLWNCNVVELASIPRTKQQLHQLNNSRSFLYFCIMQTMMRVVCPDSTWGNRFIKLMETFPEIENKAIKIDGMGIVKGWSNWQIWK